MTRVVVQINRLVVHRAGGFAAEAFGDLLQQALLQRLPPDASASDIARRLRAAAAAASAGDSARRPDGSTRMTAPIAMHTTNPVDGAAASHTTGGVAAAAGTRGTLEGGAAAAVAGRLLR